jgi:hypothetical protein
MTGFDYHVEGTWECHDILALLLFDAIERIWRFSRSKDMWHHKETLMTTKEKILLKSLNYYRQDH